MEKSQSVSIVMPTYNRGYIVSNAIESVLNQTFKNWELIIVDDGSTDDTKNVLKKYEDDTRIQTYFLEKNRGANYCRNYGIGRSHYDLIAFIDSDVVWKNNKLEMQVDRIHQCDEDIVLTYCRTRLIFPDKVVDFPDLSETPNLDGRDLKRHNYIDTNTVLIRKGVIEEEKGFDEKLSRFQEWELLIRILLKGTGKADFLDVQLCDNYIQKNSITLDGKKYYDAWKYIITKHQDLYLNQEIDNFIAKNKKVYIYGAGTFGTILKEILTEKGKYIDGFVVSRKSSDVNAIELSEVENEDGIIIGVGYALEHEIVESLQNDKFSNWISGFCW